MYNLPYHKERDEQVVKEFIDQHPFAFVTGCDSSNKPVATQVPVFCDIKDGRKILRGHIMRNTNHHKAFLHNEDVLVVFTGPHAYVSASWYSNPYQGSTWNYMSVHVNGKIGFLDEIGLEEVLRKTTLHFEDHDQRSPAVFDNLPSEYKNRAMKAVVAFEIEVTGMGSVFKLSQDRDRESYRNIIEELNRRGEAGRLIAEEMEKRTKEVFAKN